MAEIASQDSTVQSPIRLSCFRPSTERIPSADLYQAILLPERAVLQLSESGMIASLDMNHSFPIKAGTVAEMETCLIQSHCSLPSESHSTPVS